MHTTTNAQHNTVRHKDSTFSPHRHANPARITERMHLEACILGAVILENRFSEVGDILQATSFSDWRDQANHQIIWKTLDEMYPCHAIDLVSVRHYIKQHHKLDYMHHLTWCTDQVCGTNHIISHSLLLTELNIRSRFGELILALAGDAKGPYAAALLEVSNETEDPDLDIFDIVENTPSYLMDMDAPPEDIERLQDFEKMLATKARQIRKRVSISTLFDHMAMLHRHVINPSAKIAIGELSTLILDVINKGEISPAGLAELYKLRRGVLS